MDDESSDAALKGWTTPDTALKGWTTADTALKGWTTADTALKGWTTSAYRERASAHAAERDRERRVSVALSRWRLATFLPALGLLIWGAGGAGMIAFAAAGVLLLIFGVLVVRHARVDERAAWFDALRVVNERAIARIERHWDALPAADPPEGISLENHPYAIDLDLFGRASLFQWLGPAATPRGAVVLAHWLLAPAAPAEIFQRQEAIDDLAPRDRWREQQIGRAHV